VARRARRFANAIFASSVHGTTACYYQWQSRPQPCFDELHRATKPHNAYVDAPVHAADQKFSKKLENHEHAVAIRCVYYNFARIPSIVSRHASNGSRRDRSCLDSRRNYCFACLVKMNLSVIILAAAIVVAAIIYACSTRYEVVQTRTAMYNQPYVLDRWTGQATPISPP